MRLRWMPLPSKQHGLQQVATASPRSKSSSTSTEPWATHPVPCGACLLAGEGTCLVRRWAPHPLVPSCRSLRRAVYVGA